MAKKPLEDELKDYNAMFIALKDIVDEIPQEMLTVRLQPPAWSIKEIICHIVDNEINNNIHMKKIISEKRPNLQNFDDVGWAKRLEYTAWNLQEAILLFGLLRSSMGHILENLPESAWKRSGIREDTGSVSLRKLLEDANNHCKHHLARIIERKIKLEK